MDGSVDIDEPLEAGVAAALAVLAWEIELAGARCIRLDSIIGEFTQNLPAEEQERVLEGLHTVDLLSQHLTSLSAFAHKLSGEVAGELRAPIGPALGEITLGALADRMSVALGGVEKGLGDGDGAGDLDLF